MKPERLKSIDIFRGLCMAWMILSHLIDWWLISEYSWVKSFTSMILDPIGASGFLFISGVSITLSYRNKKNNTNKSEDYNPRMIRNAYLLRAFFIFVIAIIYNISISLSLNDLTWIWTWFVLLTAAISLFITLPLLKTSRIFRIIFGLIFLILNQIIVSILLPYEGESNLVGLLFHILYHDIHQDPILIFFPFFLFGTVIGDTLFNALFLDQYEKILKRSLRYRCLLSFMVIGIFLIISGVLFNFPKFLNRRTFSWIIYSLGIDVVLLSIFLFFELFEIIKTNRSYKFLFFYSYYSLTIYLCHNLLYFLFFQQLDVFNIWFFITGAFIFIGILMRAIYKTWEGKASIKVQIGILSLGFAMKIEKRLHKKNNNSVRK